MKGTVGYNFSACDSVSVSTCHSTLTDRAERIEFRQQVVVEGPAEFPSAVGKRTKMPAPGKYGGPVVRQLSLQSPSPLQSPGGLRKQLSEDDSRAVESVGVRGQGWSGGRADVRVGSGGKVGQGKAAGARPKPVRVAWAERKPEWPSGVEVIATKCQGQPRPASVRQQRVRSPLLGSKDTLVYTRLQLAERLRNAWSEREKMKPNINIFLARAPDSSRSEKEPGTEKSGAAGALQDSASAFSDPSAPLDKKRKAMKVRAFSQDFPLSDGYSNDGCLTPELTSEGSESDLKAEGKEGRHLQELNKIEIRMTKVQGEGVENKPPEGEASVGAKRCRNKSESSVEGKDPAVTAQDRRANFRRSSLLQKTITESFCSDPPEKKFDDDAKAPAKHQKKPPLVRAFSAPSQNDTAPDSRKAANPKVKALPQRRLQPSVSFDLSAPEDPTAARERAKSAPVRRRLKTAAPRRKTKDKPPSDEDDPKDTTAGKKPPRRHLHRGADVVTMVSLVSPAASDTEDSVINLPDSWRPDEAPEAPQAKPPPGEAPPAPHSFLSLRKTTKSVTFQAQPALGRSYSASFPSRRAPAGTPIVVRPPVATTPALTPAQLLDRDRRPAVFSAVTSDGRAVKRRLLRSATEFPKDGDTAYEKPREGAKSEGKPMRREADDEDAEGEGDGSGEPEFKCQKERECWHLYQKMVEKGVSVSFDTVLRGMLTPTEYRLRKNHLLSNC